MISSASPRELPAYKPSGYVKPVKMYKRYSISCIHRHIFRSLGTELRFKTRLHFKTVTYVSSQCNLTLSMMMTFLTVVRPSSNNDDDVNVDPRNANYEHCITNSLNSTSEELSYDFDAEDPVQSLPLIITNS